MKKYFQNQTGNLSFLVKGKVNGTGDSVLRLGSEGISGDRSLLYFSDGFISDRDGATLGSYSSGDFFQIEGRVRGETVSYYYNDLLVRGGSLGDDVDCNFIEFSGEDSELWYRIKGETEENKTALIITTGEEWFGGIVSGMADEVETGYFEYTGNLSENVEKLSDYSYLFFGENINENDFDDQENWASVSAPIYVLNSGVANTLGFFSGDETATAISGYTIEKTREKTGDLWKNIFRRCGVKTEGKIPRTGYGIGVFSEEVPVLERKGQFSVIIDKDSDVSIIEVNPRGAIADNGYYQYGTRLFFNVPTGSVNIATNSLRKMILNSKYIVDESFNLYYEGEEYFNLYPHPITKTVFESDKFQFEADGQIIKIGAGWSGEQFSDRGVSIRKKCRRIIFYNGVYHDGEKYYLNTPTVIGPRKTGGAEVPDQEPYVNDKWNYYGFSGVSKGNSLPIGFRMGSNMSFEVDETRLYNNLRKANIQKGVLHDVVLDCCHYYLNKTYMEANTKIKAKAYYRGK